ncbi:MAG: hypothetical protein UZ17_ACD001001781 [Acidobacteria bacterium OLB17]|nr:MAG: hypothetical protein UZ17_ACD001001781 [Acidobacteria bacterium OLB17]MCZ2390639.1 hypothetical protein [Acidobacteriota bacterium]
MFSEDSHFIYVVGVLVVGFVGVQIFYHFKFKRDTHIPELDRSLWWFRSVSVFFAVLIFVMIFYLPSTYLPTVQLEDPQEQILRQLIKNQEALAGRLGDLREVFYFLIFAIAGYILSAWRFIGKLQKERQKQLIESDPKLKKPLDL